MIPRAPASSSPHPRERHRAGRAFLVLMGRARQRNEWYLVSSHGSVLFFIAACPGCTVEEIADRLHLTQRTVWGIIGDLRRAGMLKVEREGKLHHYFVDPDGPFLHRTITGVKLGAVLGRLAEEARVVQARVR